MWKYSRETFWNFTLFKIWHSLKFEYFLKIVSFEIWIFLKIEYFWKLNIFENWIFLKIEYFWKLNIFENYLFLKIVSFWNLPLLEIVDTFKIWNLKKKTFNWKYLTWSIPRAKIHKTSPLKNTYSCNIVAVWNTYRSVLSSSLYL